MKTPTNSAYIEVIRELMQEHNMSQQKFATAIGVNQTTISQWLLGRKKPGYDCILAICTRFNVMPNELFGF